MSDMKIYRVREGVEWVNGARVAADRKVTLTDAEARFDLDQGRIALDEVADPIAEIATETARIKAEATAIEAEVAEVEESIERGARRARKRFKLTGNADGRD